MKASATLIAARYVKALFDLAASTNTEHHVEADFAKLSALLQESPEFAKLLSSPLLSREAAAEAMEAVLAKLKAHAKTREFMALLAHKRRLALLPDIIAQFDKMLAQARGELSAELISAAPLDAKDARHIADRLSKAVGKKINLAFSVRPELLGGVIINIGSKQLDGSISGKLERLANSLKVA